MREMIAKAVSVLVVGVLTILAFWFAAVHNPAEAGSETTAPLPEAAPAVQDETASRGRAVYDAQGCATCHSIEGVGNPRYPLDGTGGRWEPEEILAWVTGADFAADILAAPIVRRKQQYQELPAADLDALVLYLSGLR